MALPYELLKTLTIGGTTMGLDEDWGSEIFASQNTALPANTRTKGAEVTITEPGLYLFLSRWIFANSTTTGTKRVDHELSLKRNGSTDYVTMTRQVISNQSNTIECVTSLATALLLTESEVPANIACFGRSTLASVSAYTNVVARKLVYMGE